MTNFTKRKSIDWVVCAAGNGSRFTESGVLIPKPRLKFMGMSMLARAMSCLDIHPNDQIIIIVRKEHKTTDLHDEIISLFPWAKLRWIEIHSITSGQLETFMLAKKFLRPKASVVIWNCDTYFKSPDLARLMAQKEIDAIVPCGRMPGNEWSFFKSDFEGVIVDAAEKKRISPWASVGFYYFRDQLSLIKAAKTILKKNPPNGLQEYYISAVYTLLIKSKLRIVNSPVTVFLPFGTLPQLKKYWDIDVKKLIAENPPGTLVVDLDDTITHDDKSRSYLHKKPNRNVIETLQKYRKLGFQIIIYTARNMKTQRNDEGKVIANIGMSTLTWLNRHQIPFDSIRFGKPYAEDGFYIDDKAIRPSEFVHLSYTQLLKLTQSKVNS
ncbi:MAG: NTP transferase domain-containing protein [Bacteriovoracia bacterium]